MMKDFRELKWLIFLVVFLNNSVQAQFNYVSDEDFKQAKEIKDKYPDEEYAGLQIKEIYRFSLNKKENKVEAIVTVEETVISLKKVKVDFNKVIFFDEQSNVGRVASYNKRGKNLNTLVHESKYKSNGVFYDDAQVKYFSVPLVKTGDIIKYRYIKKYKDVRFLIRTLFHDDYPIQEKTVEFIVPSWLNLEVKEINFDGFEIEKTTSIDKFKNNVITFTSKSSAPIVKEKLAANWIKSLPHVILLSKSYKNKGKEITLFNDVSDLYKWYNSLVKKLRNKPNEFKLKTLSLVKGKQTDLEKIEAIYYWVQDNIRYIAYEDGIMGFKPATAQKVYKTRYGDCKGMANLTCEMLKIAGFDAHLTWIGTRSVPYNYDLPSLAVDNHMITMVNLDGKKYFLDATEKGVALGDYAYRIQGQDVMIENGEQFIIDTIPEVSYLNDEHSTVLQLTFNGEVLKGHGKEEFSGERKNQLYRDIANLPTLQKENVIKDYIKNSDKNLNVSQLITSDLENRNTTMTFEYDIELQNQVTSFDDQYYINTEFDKSFIQLDVKNERLNDLDFGEKILLKKRTEIKLPDDFVVDFLPNSVTMKQPDFLIDLSYQYQKEKNTLIYTKEINVPSGVVRTSYIQEWNNTIKQLKEFYNNQIILKKL